MSLLALADVRQTTRHSTRPSSCFAVRHHSNWAWVLFFPTFHSSMQGVERLSQETRVPQCRIGGKCAAFRAKTVEVSGHLPAGSLEQIEFLSPADRCPTVVHPELAVNVFGVGTHGVQGYHEFAGNFWAVQAGCE